MRIFAECRLETSFKDAHIGWAVISTDSNKETKKGLVGERWQFTKGMAHDILELEFFEQETRLIKKNAFYYLTLLKKKWNI